MTTMPVTPVAPMPDAPPWTVENTAKRVRSVCERIGRTQRELARFLGVTEATVSRWVSGKNTPDARSRRALNALAGGVETKVRTTS